MTHTVSRNVLTKTGTVYVKKKTGYLSYEDDPQVALLLYLTARLELSSGPAESAVSTVSLSNSLSDRRHQGNS